MKGCRLFIALGLALCASCATSGSNDYLYFPDLAQRVLAGDFLAFRQLLAQAETTPPGEQLEELAEVASRYVRIAPTEFLRAQSDLPTCFGVSFMGPAYTDDRGAVAKERHLRRKALESVSDKTLAPIKQSCLAELAGT